MAKKSRYQMTDRGRKGKPCWYVEDFQGREGEAVGKYLYSSRSRSIAEGFLQVCRQLERIERETNN